MQRLKDAITQWHVNKTDRPIYLGSCKAWALPSGSQSVHRIILHHKRQGWACSCEGYYFSDSPDDHCRHIKKIQRRLEKSGRK